MDGRVQIPVIDFIKQKTGVQYVDMITEAGTVKFLAEPGHPEMKEMIKKSLMISIDAHKSKNVFIVAHVNCAGNPVSEMVQKKAACASKSYY